MLIVNNESVPQSPPRLSEVLFDPGDRSFSSLAALPSNVEAIESGLLFATGLLGFVAITGETGAGKSVILGALNLVLGRRADRGMIREGPAKWVGGVGVATDHALGREVLELKTSLGRSQQAGILGVEVGPRIERRLRGGMSIFLDGKAQAQARRSADTGEWILPRLAEQGTGGAGMVGVTASTGLVR